MKTNQELHTQATEMFQEIQAITRHTSLIRVMDNSIYELACSYDAINEGHPKAAAMKQTIEDLVNINALLLDGFEKNSDKLVDMADRLSRNLSQVG